MIYLIGDTHGTEDFRSFMSLRDRVRDGRISMSPDKDFVVVLGDWGVIWDNVPSREEKRILPMWENAPWTTLVVDGNHENFARLFAYPEVLFGGTMARQISDRIFNLKRGEIYNICGHKVFIFGGGLSIDQERRVEGVSWWREELPTTLEMDNGLGKLQKHGNKVDYIFTHEAPRRFVPKLLGTTKIDYTLPESLKYKSPLAGYFDHLFDEITFKAWFNGHYHCDMRFVENDKVLYTLYRGIYGITDEQKVRLVKEAKK